MTTTFSSWLIEIQTTKMEKPIQVQVDNRIIIGRKDTTGELADPDIDLTDYDAESLGVSRHHIMIYQERNRLKVKDMNTGNGTMLNGARLQPEKPYNLQHEDYLQLGHMRMDLRIIIAPSYRSSIQSQQSLMIKESQTEPGKGQLILIVEDDIGTAKLVALIMERAGYTTAISRDVLGAIRLFNQQKPNAILLDLMLPGMDGLEFCRYVRRDVKRNDTPIIVITASPSKENIESAMQASADIVLGKPLNAQELTHVVSSLLSYHESGVSTLQTKHLVGTAPLRRIAPDERHIAAVLFVAGHNDNPVVVNLDQPMSFGRIANQKAKNHVDLSKYNAVDYGVSRVHMFLQHKDGQFYVEDNGSINGTFVNGEPIPANELTPIKNADEIRLGKLRTYIYFLTDEERGMPEAPPASVTGSDDTQELTAAEPEAPVELDVPEQKSEPEQPGTDPNLP